MKKKPLGSTGIEVSEIAFGGVEIGMPYGIGIESKRDMLSEDAAIELLHAALDTGINFFDTARLYGESEAIMGRAFRGLRKEIILSTKCTHIHKEDGRLPGKERLTKIIQGSLQESLRDLQTDYVDVFMLHTADQQILDSEEIARAFEDLQKAGYARALGVSVYLPEETKKVLDFCNWDVIQLPFNLMDQRQQALFSLAAESGVGIVVRSVLLKGLLSERGKNLHPALQDVENHIASYYSLLGKAISDLPTLAVQFALSFCEVSTILIGMDRLDYLRKSLEMIRGHVIDEKLLQQLQNMAYPDPSFLNLPLWDQKGWLK